VSAQATPRQSVNTSGQGVGYVIDEWAWGEQLIKED
jgi:hypothetical protein